MSSSPALAFETGHLRLVEDAADIGGLEDEPGEGLLADGPGLGQPVDPVEQRPAPVPVHDMDRERQVGAQDTLVLLGPATRCCQYLCRPHLEPRPPLRTVVPPLGQAQDPGELVHYELGLGEAGEAPKLGNVPMHGQQPRDELGGDVGH